LLLERPGELISREEIRLHLWPADIFVDFERSLNSAVKKLRSELEDSPHEPRFIETQSRKGYRFIAPLLGPESEAVDAPTSRSETNLHAEPNLSQPILKNFAGGAGFP
jgi:DNA-binding winged helix-turn-helix (wHTH) protein